MSEINLITHPSLLRLEFNITYCSWSPTVRFIDLYYLIILVCFSNIFFAALLNNFLNSSFFKTNFVAHVSLYLTKTTLFYTFISFALIPANFRLLEILKYTSFTPQHLPTLFGKTVQITLFNQIIWKLQTLFLCICMSVLLFYFLLLLLAACCCSAEQ